MRRRSFRIMVAVFCPCFPIFIPFLVNMRVYVSTTSLVASLLQIGDIFAVQFQTAFSA